jgi:signal transduction histidine kinase
MTSRFLPLAAVVLVPVVVLAGFSWRGVQAQRRAARADAEESARQLAEVKANEWSDRLAGRTRTGRKFSDPPEPGDGPEFEPLAAQGEAALRKLRDDPSAGLSSTGLPLRVLAAFRLYERTGTEIDALALLNLATGDCPSVLTPVVFARLRNAPTSEAESRWQTLHEANDLLRRHPEVSATGTWLIEQGKLWWMAVEGETIRFFDASDLSRLPVSTASSLRPWETVRFTLHGKPLSGPNDALVLAKRDISPAGLSVEVIATAPSQIDSTVRRQGTWTLSVLGVTVCVAITGLGLIQRLMARERRLNELKSHFVASVSHELRAPVGSIRLMADALDGGKVSPETAAGFHRLISREGNRLSNLIENVLDFARIEQGRKHWRFEAVDLPALVTGTVEVMKPVALEKRIALEIFHEAFDLEPVLDAAALQQALINLLDNAIKFSPPNSTIDVRLSADERHCRLAVHDHGPGIPAAERAKIFQRFYRPGNELRRETQGTGIGLSLVKAIAEAHGGRVELDSHPGHGSTFTLVLPHDATAGH